MFKIIIQKQNIFFIPFGDKYFAFSCVGKCYDWLKFTYVLRGKYMV